MNAYVVNLTVPSVLKPGIRSGLFSSLRYRLSMYGCMNPINVIDAAARPGVFANMSTLSPMAKHSNNCAHLGYVLGNSSARYVYNKGVATPIMWMWPNNNACSSVNAIINIMNINGVLMN